MLPRASTAKLATRAITLRGRRGRVNFKEGDGSLADSIGIGEASGSGKSRSKSANRSYIVTQDLARLLDHPDEEIREAAEDAIGFIEVDPEEEPAPTGVGA